jgi:hypothetical protein
MEKHHGLFYFLAKNSNLKVPQEVFQESPTTHETQTTLPRCSISPFLECAGTARWIFHIQTCIPKEI